MSRAGGQRGLRQVSREQGEGCPAECQQWQAKIAAQFESKPHYLIPILQFIQGEAGFLPREALRAAARFLRLSESKVYGVASFYAQFHFEPRGRNKVTVCRGTACHVRGSGRLLSELEKHMGVTAGGTTPDLAFTLETVACFGACALAPVVVINDQVHRQQTSASLKQMVTEIRDQTIRGKPGKARPPRAKQARRKK
jgi:NADH-quinone oxidoreductase subunit E